jgi:hypothetical protein
MANTRSAPALPAPLTDETRTIKLNIVSDEIDFPLRASHYRFVRVLGSGAFSIVVLVINI